MGRMGVCERTEDDVAMIKFGDFWEQRLLKGGAADLALISTKAEWGLRTFTPLARNSSLAPLSEPTRGRTDLLSRAIV